MWRMRFIASVPIDARSMWRMRFIASLQFTDFSPGRILYSSIPQSHLRKHRQSLRQCRIALRHAVVSHGDFQGARLADEDAQAFGARDSRVEQVALEQH